MVYCRKCGERIEKGTGTCPHCGEDQQDDEAPSDVTFDDFQKVIERLIDDAIDHIATDLPTIEHDLRVDQFEFAVEMYVIGYVKGQVETALGFAAIQEGDSYPEETMTPFNQFIVERVQERSDEIRTHLQTE